MIIDCKTVRSAMLYEAKEKITEIGAQPTLAIIQVEGDDASDVYIRNKEKTCKEIGIQTNIVKLPCKTSFEQIVNVICMYSQMSKINGIMLQLPLPEHLKGRERELLDLIPYDKDVDGLSSESIGRLWSGQECIAPATPTGILRLLPKDLSGKKATIIGRSNLVGKPLIKMLMDRNATVTVCHSKTSRRVLEDCLQYADIVVSAIGKPKYICAENFQNMVFSDADYWIDVGINRDKDGKLCGDIEPNDLTMPYMRITPVPGGVGQLTTAQLALNVIKAYELQHRS